MRVILWFFAVIGFCAALVVALVVVAAFHFGSRPAPIADQTVLALDLDQPITETGRPPALDRVLNPRTAAFGTLLYALRRGAADPRVKGMVARAGSMQLGLAQAEELRGAIEAFRAKGKFAYAFADSFGDLSGGMAPYYLASGFDQIWLQPAGDLGLTGIAAELPFFKGSLDKLGIAAEFERRGEFKTAATEFTDTKLEDTDRTATTAMVGSLYDELVRGIAEGRKLPADQVRTLVDGGPYTAEEALAQHLVDHLGYSDEVEAAARRQAGPQARIMAATAYAGAIGVGDAARLPAASIAVIRAVGPIVSGRSDNPFGGATDIGADSMVDAFDEAIKDKNVKAIVFRIDSPGGSEIASDTIWRAVERAQQAGKPVIVSMGDEAASGGYYVAAGADRIVAEPMTLTGSIGVFAGKFVLSGLWDKLGVSWDQVAIGKNAAMASSLDAFTPAQRQRFAAMVDQAYQSFVARVAQGRHMTPAAVDAVARGRVWTGVQAKQNGLVDELGGLDDAVRLAKDAAKLPEDQPIALRELPERRSPLQAILEGLMGGGQGPSQAFDALRRLAALEPLLRRLDGLAAPQGVTMRPIELRD